MYVQYVNTIRENVNLKLQELNNDMVKEITVLTHNYSTLHMKVDIIADVVTQSIEWYNSFVPKFEKKVTVDATSFGDIVKLLGTLKDLMSKSRSSTSSVFTPGFLTQNFSLLESIIHKELAPLVKLLPLMPTGAPPIVTGMQGGERRHVGIVKGEGGSLKIGEDAKVVEKVLTTQIPVTMQSKTDPITSTTTTMPLKKGIVIGGTSSSLNPSLRKQIMGKGNK